jgi:hypothetical protein
MAKRDHAAELRRWNAGERLDIGPTIRSLPADIDPALAVPVVLQYLERSIYGFAKSCEKLPPAVIRGVLAAKQDEPDHLFLRLAVVDEGSDAELARSWARAVEALRGLDLTYGWGSKQRRDRFKSLAKDPHVLHAIQATVAHSKAVRLDLLAVLVADGSDASFDALVPHLDAAFVGADARLERLTRLRRHATRTKALDALFAEIDKALDTRNAASPALALGPLLGIGEVDELWFSAFVWSEEDNDNRVSRVQGHVDVDSRSAEWFSVSMSNMKRGGGIDRDYTSFTATELHADGLGLGRCDAPELPQWLAKVATKLDCTWQEIRPRTNLRGAKRRRIAAWLTG